jgi:hypothetical protein
MDAIGYQDLQEAFLWFFGPVLVSLMFVLIAGGVLSAIGVIVLGLANRLTR